MAWTQADVDRLKDAIATGARVVQYADKRIEYRDQADMFKALNAMQAEANPGGKSGRGRRRFGATDKGLD